jgi:recombination protein RecA
VSNGNSRIVRIHKARRAFINRRKGRENLENAVRTKKIYRNKTIIINIGSKERREGKGVLLPLSSLLLPPNNNTMAKKETEGGAQNPQSEKLKALQAAMSKIEKDFGKGSIMKLGDEHIENVEVIPTGSISLNAALGVGGYPRGRIIEIYGPESSGKTTLAIHAIAEAQKQGGIAAFIDAEHAFDRFYAQKLGVDVDNLWISQPDNGEQALQIADQLISSAAVDIVVIDSVAALTPKKEIEGDMGDNVVGLQARLMSQALRKLTSTISKTNTTCIFINQLREKIGVMFGNPETTTGGNALKFYASVRLDIRRVTSIKDGDEVIGNQVRVKIVKNKVAPPFRKAEFEITFGEGISKIGEIVDLGVEYGIIQKSGSWFSYDGTKLAQGRDAVKKLLKDNPELCEQLEAKIMAELTGK